MNYQPCTSAPDSYLAIQVQTASPAKLHLMLIEGAIRWSETTKQLWQRGDHAAAGTAFTRCHQILGELLAGVRADQSELARKVASVYAYLFRTFTEALQDHDLRKVDHVLSVLRIEQETWRQVCAEYGSDRAAAPETARGGSGAMASSEPHAATSTVKPAIPSGSPEAAPMGISIEA